MSAARNNYCYICREKAAEKSMIDHQKNHEEEIKKMKLSSDMKDVVVTNCKVCEKPFNLTRMRSHTRTAHKMKITEYKERYNQHYYDPLQLVLHRCGICGEYLLLDSDVVSQHLRSNTKTHDSITHANYNKKFMTIRSYIKLEKLEFEEESVPQMTTRVSISEDTDAREEVEEFREFYKKLSGNLHFPLLESLYSINNLSPENVHQFCYNFRNLAV